MVVEGSAGRAVKGRTDGFGNGASEESEAFPCGRDNGSRNKRYIFLFSYLEFSPLIIFLVVLYILI